MIKLLSVRFRTDGLHTTKFNEILSTVKNSSIMTWERIHIHGEYNLKKLFDNREMSTFEFESFRD
jgi:hypothetical protein